MKKSKLGDKSIYVGRVSSLIKREIAVLFGKMNASLLKNMTVIDVDVLPDLSVSKIFVTFSDQNVEKNEIVNYLNKNYSYLLRKHLSQNVRLRKVPKLDFVYDDFTERSRNLSKLISGLK